METAVDNKRNFTWIASMLVLFAVCLRVTPHPANFAPVAAISLFAGAVLPRKLAVVTPLVAMVVSDLIIGLHHLILVTWGVYALIAFVSNRWLRKPTPIRGGILTLGSSLFFFFVSNVAVWVEGALYPRTLSGLGDCFAMALPFFRATLMSDLLFTSCLFGMYYAVARLAVYLQKGLVHGT